jgi:hypothetical protein
MKQVVLAIALLIAASDAASAEARSRLGGIDGVSSCNAVSAYELWNSAHHSARSGDAVAELYVMDSEAGEGAILLIGQDGTGVEPVCLRISRSNDNAVAVRASGATGAFEVEGGSHRFRVSVDAAARVFLDGVMIGQIR